MSEKKTPDLSQEKRSKILKAAHARFLYYGVSKTTMRDIAEDLGISVSNLYLYFENKREIMLAIAQSCREEQDLNFEQIYRDPNLTPSQKLENFLVEKLRRSKQFIACSPKAKELFAYLVQQFPHRVPDWHQKLEDNICAVLQEGADSGHFRIDDARLHAHSLRVATTQFYLPAHIELPVPPDDAELVALVRWYLSLVETDLAKEQKS